MKNLSACGMLVAALFLAKPASAAPIQWSSAVGGNDHYYDFVFASNIAWTDANIAAGASSFLGLAGHLATITSAGENSFLTTLVSTSLAGTDIGPWFGAFQPTQLASQTNPTLNWTWVTGELWGFTSWRPLDLSIYPFAEPNDIDNVENNQENFGHFHSPGPSPWFWNDAPNVVGAPGYLVEYEPSLTAVPEPATLTLIGLGLAAARLSRKRRLRR